MNHRGWVFSAIVLIVLAVDQASKSAVRATMSLRQALWLIPGVFQLTYVRNTGAAFGVFPGQRTIFIGASLIVLAFVAAIWRRIHPTQWIAIVALALITGGAIGNLIDRVLIGQVTDFFYFTPIDFPVFNVADTAIFVGVLTLTLWLLFAPDPARETAREDDGEDAEGSPSAPTRTPLDDEHGASEGSREGNA